MKKIQRTLAVMLIGVMMFSTNVYANEEQESVNIIEDEIYNDGGVMPLYTYIDVITAAITIDNNGRCVFTGSVTALGFDVKIELYLQRSRNQLFWDSIMGGIKTVDQSGAIEYSLNLQPDDYFYRAKVVVSVLDDNKNVIETQTVYSDSERY